MEELLLSILNKMFLHCKLFVVEDLLKQYLSEPKNVIYKEHNILCKYDKLAISFNTNDKGYIDLIELFPEQ